MLLDFIRKLFKGNNNDCAANQTEPQTVQPQVILASPENDAKAAPVFSPASEVASVSFDSEKAISEVGHAMLDAMAIELEEIKVLAEEFFASEKYLQPQALALFRGRQWEKCIRRCRYAAEAYFAGQDQAVQECWQETLAQAQETDSPEWTCILLRNAFKHRFGADLLRSTVVEQVLTQLREKEHAWRQCFAVPPESTKEKGIRILRGHYGECDYCIGYDYAYQVFVAFKPDDNYYHWNDYIIYLIDRQTAASMLHSSLNEYPEPSDPEAAERYYKSASNSEIEDRVIR